MNKRLAGLALAVAGVLALASPSTAGSPPPISITPGHPTVVAVGEPFTFEFTGCDGGTVEVILAFVPAGGGEVFQWQGTLPGGSGSWTHTPTEPGIFKFIVNCFQDGGLDSAEEIPFEVVPGVPTTPPPVETTAPPAVTTAAPGVTTAPPAVTTAAPGVTTSLAGATTSVASGGPTTAAATSTTGSALSQGTLPATGQGDGTALLVTAAALLALGGTLVLVRRRAA